jgi:RNA polymerase sigma factor (sigma-70 family)
MLPRAYIDDQLRSARAMTGASVENDWELLSAYAHRGEQRAFAALVRRYAGLVHATAARRAGGDSHLADDVTQAVFLLLSRRAAQIKRGTTVAGWLRLATQFATNNAMRIQRRRTRHERAAAAGARAQRAVREVSPDEAWPLLDAALDRLPVSERDAVLLRYFEGMSVGEMAERLRIDRRAAAKRLARGLARLRRLFASQRVSLSELSIAGALSSAEIHNAPPQLVSAVLTSATAPPPSLSILAASSWRWMAWVNLKATLATAAVIAVIIGSAGVAGHLAYRGRSAAARESSAPPAPVVIPVINTAAFDVPEVTFEPIGPGKNAVHVVARNNASTDRWVGITVTARSNDRRSEWKGMKGIGSPEFVDGHYVAARTPNLPAGAAKDLRYVFQIPEPFGPAATITVEVFDQSPGNPRPAALVTRQFTASKLPARDFNWNALPPASADETAAAEALLAEVQLRLRLGLHGRAEALFTSDWQAAEQTYLRDDFRKRVSPKDIAWHTWDAARLAVFTPREVRRSGDDSLVLLVNDEEQVRPIELARDSNGRWRIDWIYGTSK